MSEELKLTPAPLVASSITQRSPQIGQLALSLSRAQRAMEAAQKDADNPFFHSRYADLASVWKACREPLGSNELAVIQSPSYDGEVVLVETILTHSSEQWISSVLRVLPGYTDKQGEFYSLRDAQSVGSAITYARRYSLAAMVGIAPEDDDGNAASGQGRPDKAQKEEKESGTLTDEPVPAKYWDIKKKDGPQAANDYLSGIFDGQKCGVRKTEHGWKVVLFGEVKGSVLMPKPGKEAPAGADIQGGQGKAVPTWRNAVCHIGKPNGPIKGKPLGRLEPDALEWLLGEMRNKGDRASAADKKLLAALLLWKEEEEHPDHGAPATATGTEGVNRQILRENLEFAGIKDEALFMAVVRRDGYTKAQKATDITDAEAARMVQNFPAIDAACCDAQAMAEDQLPGLEPGPTEEGK